MQLFNSEQFLVAIGSFILFSPFIYAAYKVYNRYKNDIGVTLDFQQTADKHKLKQLFNDSFHKIEPDDVVVWSAGGMSPNLYSEATDAIEKAVKKGVKFIWLCGPQVIVKKYPEDSGDLDDINWSEYNPILGLAQNYKENCKVLYDNKTEAKSRSHFVFPKNSSDSFYYIEKRHPLGEPISARFSTSITPKIKEELFDDWEKYTSSYKPISVESFRKLSLTMLEDIEAH